MAAAKQTRLTLMPVPDAELKAFCNHMQACLVCGNRTVFKHYGADACGSCASFFRRTVSYGLSYKCTCRMPYRRKKKGCRHCRFELCLTAGMDATDVKSIKTIQTSDDSLIGKLLSCQSRLYVIRGLYLREVDAQSGDGLKRSLAHTRRRRSVQQVSSVEYRVSTAFWTDYLGSIDYFKDGASPELVTAHFFSIWLLLEQLMASVWNGNLEREMCISDHETTLKLSHDYFVEMYRTPEMQWVSDPNAMATHAVEYCLEILHLAREVRRASLDDHEMATLMQLLIAHYEKDLFVDQYALQRFVGRVLRELHEHYQSTYLDYAERLATLTSILGQFHEKFRAHEEFYTLLSLYDNSDGLSWTGFSNFIDLRRSIKL